mmetsp:Transcript_14835/g.29254  ORF Transcript_14835/g.29254 Transcript_14835/m.29254 type:complete len:223 (+) Transcript_14835:1292-1960(+)
MASRHHILRFLSPPAVTNLTESGAQAIAQRVPAMPAGFWNSPTNSDSLPLYRQALESEPTETAHSPSGEYRTQFTKFVCTLCTVFKANGGPSWHATPMSSLPVMIRNGRCDRKEMELTCFVCPPTCPVLAPVSIIKATAFVSLPSPAATMRVESPLKDTSFTTPSQSLYSAFIKLSPREPHMRIAPVTSPETTQLPFGEIATHVVCFTCCFQQKMSSIFSAA